jgi:uncharacterized protein (UPF0332 family)
VTATPDEHLDQARRNRAVAEQMLDEHADDPTYVQWAVATIFYCAVHCIQAHLVRHGQNPRTHVARGQLIADPRYGVPTDVQSAYDLLEQRSRAARYELATFDAATVRQRLLGHYLARITAFIRL